MSQNEESTVCGWHALRVRPRQEIILARQLTGMSMHAFVPVLRSKRCYAGVDLEVSVPLVAGYVFLEGDASALQKAFKTGRVVCARAIEQESCLAAELRSWWRGTMQVANAPAVTDAVPNRQQLEGRLVTLRECVLDWLGDAGDHQQIPPDLPASGPITFFESARSDGISAATW